MMADVVRDPAPVLREKATPVVLPISKEDETIGHLLLDYVIRSRDDELAKKEGLRPAVGIAAPQIGIAKRMTAIVVDIPTKEELQHYEFILVNPKMLRQSARRTALAQGEGCLSVDEEHPGLVPRAYHIKVEAYDLLRKETITVRASGYLAIIMQHEIDHLDGVLFYDHINPIDPWHAQDDWVIIE